MSPPASSMRRSRAQQGSRLPMQAALALAFCLGTALVALVSMPAALAQPEAGTIRAALAARMAGPAAGAPQNVSKPDAAAKAGRPQPKAAPAAVPKPAPAAADMPAAVAPEATAEAADAAPMLPAPGAKAPLAPAVPKEDPASTDVSPDAPKLSIRRITCTDVAPGQRHTCVEQRLFGKCDAPYMAEFHYCSETCGRAPCKECDDVPPTDEYGCEQQAKFGKCGEAWMAAGGYCAKSCGFTPCPPSEAERRNFTLAYARRDDAAMPVGAAIPGLAGVDGPDAKAAVPKAGPEGADAAIDGPAPRPVGGVMGMPPKPAAAAAAAPREPEVVKQGGL